MARPGSARVGHTFGATWRPPVWGWRGRTVVVSPDARLLLRSRSANRQALGRRPCRVPVAACDPAPALSSPKPSSHSARHLQKLPLWASAQHPLGLTWLRQAHNSQFRIPDEHARPDLSKVQVPSGARRLAVRCCIPIQVIQHLDTCRCLLALHLLLHPPLSSETTRKGCHSNYLSKPSPSLHSLLEDGGVTSSLVSIPSDASPAATSRYPPRTSSGQPE